MLNKIISDAVKLRKRRLSALIRAEKNAKNPEFKQLWANKKEELLKLDL
jgi:hypothetical protein